MNLRPFNPNQDSENETTANNVRSTKAGASQSEHGNNESKESIPENQASSKEGNDSMPVNTESTNNFNAPGNVIILEHMEQGSNEWHDARRGRITMSNAKALLTGGKGVTRKAYLMNVASEIVTGITAETYKSWAMERGNILEPFAREAYAVVTGCEVKQVGLGYLNEDRLISASPDGIAPDRGIEIKCQLPKNHVNTLHNGINPKQFEDQMQGCMWVFDKPQWDYVSFCPECKDNPIFIYTVYRDEEVIKRIEESAMRGIDEIKAIVASVKKKPVAELTDICDDALLLIETLRNDEPEIF